MTDNLNWTTIHLTQIFFFFAFLFKLLARNLLSSNIYLCDVLLLSKVRNIARISNIILFEGEFSWFFVFVQITNARKIRWKNGNVKQTPVKIFIENADCFVVLLRSIYQIIYFISCSILFSPIERFISLAYRIAI